MKALSGIIFSPQENVALRNDMSQSFRAVLVIIENDDNSSHRCRRHLSVGLKLEAHVLPIYFSCVLVNIE